MQKLDRRIDVSQATGPGEFAPLAASVCLPDPASLPARPVAIFAVPGGGHTRGYFDMSFPGHTGYSEAAYQVARGSIYVAVAAVPCVQNQGHRNRGCADRARRPTNASVSPR